MVSFQETHPVKIIMDAVKELCKKNPSIMHSMSPLNRGGSTPTMSALRQTLGIVDEDSDRANVVSSQAFTSPTPIHFECETQILAKFEPEQIEVSIDAIFNTIENLAKSKDLLMNPSYYYEDYKALSVYVEYFYSNKERNIEIDEAEARLLTSSSDPVFEKAKFTSYLDTEIFVQALMTTYFFHLLMEKVYVKHLHIEHDAAVTRLDKNGIMLFKLMGLSIKSNVWRYIQTQDLPRSLSPVANMDLGLKRNHPFNYLGELDQRATRINFKRLFLIRLRRFYLSLAACFVGLRASAWFQIVEPCLLTLINLGNVLYFLPRLLSDLGNLLYCVFILEHDESISKMDVLKMHFRRRFEFISRDVIWFLNGILSLFVFRGSLAWMGLYSNLVVQIIDMLLQISVYCDHKEHMQQIPELLSKFGLPEENPKFKVIHNEVNQRMDIDLQIFSYRMNSGVLISVTSLLIVPFFSSISTYIALFGAAVALVFSYIQYHEINVRLERRRGIPSMFNHNFPYENTFISNAGLAQCS